MAIVLKGAAPTDEVGERFVFTTWEWIPTRMICEQVNEDVLPWGTNDAAMAEGDVVDLANQLAGFLGDTGDEEFKTTQMGVEFCVTRDKLEEFIDFLRACGGFESE